MKARDIIYVDFETHGIERRPKYPPAPVGVAVLKPGEENAQYYAWGHPNANNTSRESGARIVRELWAGARSMRWVLGFYNAKFDIDVARAHFNMDLPPPEAIDDALILAVLKDSRKLNHQLKTLAKEWLGLDDPEQDELKAWILQNVPEAKRAKSTWGAHISRAPGDLVGRYACKDVVLTRMMREYLQETADAMPEAYLRERRLLPVILGMEERGIPIDIPALERDVPLYTQALEKLDDEIRNYMDLPLGETLDGNAFADAIQKFGTPGVGWPVTEKGFPSTAAETLDLVLADRDLYGALQYRGILAHSLSTFMRPWLEHTVDGRFHVQWNALKGEKGLGAGTGRLSSSPNLQNIITEENCDKADASKPDDYPALPRLRRYVAPGRGRVLVGRDFNQQEYRVFAHYEDGALAKGYCEDPWMDIHVFVMNMLNEMAQLGIERKATKTLNFGILFGMGKGKLSIKIKRNLDETSAIIGAYLSAFPGIKALREQMDIFDRTKQPIQTIGGRIYYAEEPRIIKGVYRRFGYKLVNLLCQGGAADVTKESMLVYATAAPAGALCLSIHDELVAECDKQDKDIVQTQLKIAMEENALSKALDVPMLSEGYWGHNLQDLIDVPRGQ